MGRVGEVYESTLTITMPALPFPNLSGENHTTTSPSTPDYNCIAWAAEEDDRWWWPVPAGAVYWPAGAAAVETVDAFIFAFGTLGYTVSQSRDLEDGLQKVALYVGANGLPTHMARQLSDGTWTSKLGQSNDINHLTLEAISGPAYGTVLVCLCRPQTRSLLVMGLVSP